MTLLGHDEAWRQWRDALSGARMHHAWLLAGKRGLGKMSFAEAAARELCAEPGVAQPTGPHPDVHVLTHQPKDEKEERKRDEGKPYEVRRNITVAQIRAMQQKLTTRPTLGARRAVIIDPADDLEKSASNALLKSLEEPPTGTFFLLIAHRPARLLPTIRSRCRMLRFPALGERELADWLGTRAPEADAETREAAARAASGSPGVALDFVQRDLGPLHTLMARIVREGDEALDLRGRLAEAVGTRPDRERIAAILDLARAVLANELDRKGRNGWPGLIDAHAALVRLAGEAPTYNFDPGLLVMEIGTLLASAAPASERADA
ncbi:DNA polymerase III subunit delta' [Pelagerythrobacter rhizovicinus]|uniref:DNA polymerase III subunit delta n=1 Tax=Pelagerythrobacter rhizovicinus TaxID=2268576 RepID=A0A4Q2KP32_9SPHN|nr:DNA polymerase III subunit delta' [Pelagerythrobacter rhizovicinus]RXZ66100.1 DNA polymerase III subunit delta' [Pelagerythrobacter rhizovicinus]